MDKIIYQGRQIEAERVNEMNGCLLIATRKNWSLQHDGEEALYRDRAGRYYLRRRLKICDLDGDTERHVSGREHVHRLSLTAAVQWAIMRCNADTDDLRRDFLSEMQELARLRAEGENTLDLDDPALGSYPEGHPLYQPSTLWQPKEDAPRRITYRNTESPEADKAMRLDVAFDLPPLFAALLLAFQHRHGINPAALTRACLCWYLEEIFDHPFNGGETERSTVENIREDGYLNAPDEKQTAILLRAAGLTEADLHHPPAPPEKPLGIQPRGLRLDG